MRIIIMLLALMPLLLSTDVCAQPETRPEPALLEKWARADISTPDGHIAKPVLPEETLSPPQDDWRPARGAEIYLYANGAFKMRHWLYGMSIGLLEYSANGTYTCHDDKSWLELVFAEAPRPVENAFLDQFAAGGQNYAQVTLSRARICILETIDDSRLKIALYGYDAAGMEYAHGQAVFEQQP